MVSPLIVVSINPTKPTRGLDALSQLVGLMDRLDGRNGATALDVGWLGLLIAYVYTHLPTASQAVRPVRSLSKKRGHWATYIQVRSVDTHMHA